MRILLFGPNGQVGAEVRRQAAGSGMSLICVDRARCDLGDAKAAAAIVDGAECDAVVNAAAYTAVDKAEADEAAAFALNAAAPGSIADACARRSLPLVHFSTDYVFDGEGRRAYLETDATGPINAYGRTKLEGERRVAAAGGPHAIVRLSWVFSAHGSNFVKTMLRLGRERKTVRVVADQEGKPTFAGDAAGFALTVAARLAGDPSLGGVYHFAGAPATTWAGFAEEIFRAAAMAVEVVPIPTSDYPTPARRPRYSVLDTNKGQTAFQTRASSWRTGLVEAIGALKSEERAQ